MKLTIAAQSRVDKAVYVVSTTTKSTQIVEVVGEACETLVGQEMDWSTMSHSPEWLVTRFYEGWRLFLLHDNNFVWSMIVEND